MAVPHLMQLITNLSMYRPRYNSRVVHGSVFSPQLPFNQFSIFIFIHIPSTLDKFRKCHYINHTRNWNQILLKSEFPNTPIKNFTYLWCELLLVYVYAVISGRKSKTSKHTKGVPQPHLHVIKREANFISPLILRIKSWNPERNIFFHFNSVLPFKFKCVTV